MANLRSQGQGLCDQEDLEESCKREVRRLVGETEEQWRTALQTAEEALSHAQTQGLLDTFTTQSESTQCWIRDQEQKLLSVAGFMQVEEKLEAAKVSFTLHVDSFVKVVVGCNHSAMSWFSTKRSVKRYFFSSGCAGLPT